MSWYAYCIVEQRVYQGTNRARRPFPMNGLHGVDGAQVLAYPSGDFAVIVSEYVRSGSIDHKSVVEHARIVGECFRQGTVLPFRFGTLFETEEAIRQSVRANRKTFAATVSLLRGKSEMRLKVMVPERLLANCAGLDIELPIAVGAEYLDKLRIKASRDRERQTKARTLSMQVHKLFSPLEEEVSCKRTDTGSLVIDIAHLIDSATVEKYQNRFNTATKQMKDCQLALSGPWPPYHFMPHKLRTVSN
jgi:hypothetical protein